MDKKDSCEYCGSDLCKRRKTIPFHSMGKTVYFEGVPVWFCPDCGYTEFDALVYKDLETRVRETGKATRTICFPLLRLTRARPARAGVAGPRKPARNRSGLPSP